MEIWPSAGATTIPSCTGVTRHRIAWKNSAHQIVRKVPQLEPAKWRPDPEQDETGQRKPPDKRIALLVKWVGSAREWSWRSTSGQVPALIFVFLPIRKRTLAFRLFRCGGGRDQGIIVTGGGSRFGASFSSAIRCKFLPAPPGPRAADSTYWHKARRFAKKPGHGSRARQCGPDRAR